jgi:hypothetical protein
MVILRYYFQQTLRTFGLHDDHALWIEKGRGTFVSREGIAPQKYSRYLTNLKTSFR